MLKTSSAIIVLLATIGGCKFSKDSSDLQQRNQGEEQCSQNSHSDRKLCIVWGREGSISQFKYVLHDKLESTLTTDYVAGGVSGLEYVVEGGVVLIVSGGKDDKPLTVDTEFGEFVFDSEKSSQPPPRSKSSLSKVQLVFDHKAKVRAKANELVLETSNGRSFDLQVMSNESQEAAKLMRRFLTTKMNGEKDPYIEVAIVGFKSPFASDVFVALQLQHNAHLSRLEGY